MSYNKTKYIFTGSELDIQSHIVDNINEICRNCFFGTVNHIQTNIKIKSAIGHGVYDALVYHGNNTATLIEVKKYKDEVYLMSAIGQILYYAELVKIHLENYPRMVIASNYIPDSIRAVIKANNLKIRLLEVDGDKITLY